MLRFPSDPEAPASDVINCHCRLSPHVLLEGESIDENRDYVTERDLRNSGEKGKINYGKAVFSGQRTLLEYWEKHKAEFTEIKTKEAYLETARWQLRQPLKKEVLEEISRPDGSIERYYYPQNYLVATSNDGHLRAFFRPVRKEDYWRHEFPRNQT